MRGAFHNNFIISLFINTIYSPPQCRFLSHVPASCERGKIIFQCTPLFSSRSCVNPSGFVGNTELAGLLKSTLSMRCELRYVRIASCGKVAKGNFLRPERVFIVLLTQLHRKEHALSSVNGYHIQLWFISDSNAGSQLSHSINAPSKRFEPSSRA